MMISIKVFYRPHLLIRRSSYAPRSPKWCGIKKSTIPHVFYDKSFDVYVSSDKSFIQNWMNTHIIRKVAKMSSDLQKSELPFPVGFDIEWKPSFIKKQNLASIIQFATQESSLIIQMKYLNEIPNELLQVINSTNILKVGVGVRDDLQRLKNDHGISFGAYLDIGHVSRRAANLGSCGLQALCTHYFGQDSKMTKNRAVTMGNWETPNLSQDQIMYAAYDAIAAVEIYRKMQSLNLIKREAVFDSENINWIDETLKTLYQQQLAAESLLKANEKVEPVVMTSGSQESINLSAAPSSMASQVTASLIPPSLAIDPQIFPLTRKAIQRVVSQTDESSFKMESLLKHVYEIDSSWYEKSVSAKHDIKDFWRRSLSTYFTRFGMVVNYYTIPQVKSRIQTFNRKLKDLVSTSSDINANKDTDTTDSIGTCIDGSKSLNSPYNDKIQRDYFSDKLLQQNILKMQQYIDNFEQNDKNDKRTVVLMLAVNDITISVSQGSNKSISGEKEAQRLLDIFINFQRTIPSSTWLQFMKREELEPVEIIQHVLHLNDTCFSHTHKY